ncbi:hypothetical protein B0H14DRAFT_3154310 [Mycena olivaceomarginata]|nr:hypothetical protein B0H14DRAFT_3154310 [Mycena olivaceomarginata]
MLPAESFRPLLTCTNLTEVHLVVGHGIEIDNAFLKQMHCPCLEFLALVFDATLVDPHATKEKRGAGISNLALVELEVVQSPIESAAAVASFLSAIFPNLQVVLSREEGRNVLIQDGEEILLAWASVGELVQVISSARAQEHYAPDTMLVDGE